ncbi:S10 family peptidase [Nocardia terpenica]|uniref:Peptidase S1 n=1 Tax=Nocardia terpenica TaxID=455432 RepID=A0A164MBU6_9NOCA|nr:peptidase S1 [Nocardia terpenica]KZM73221.1 peptidase S1 [Nocardia terpenica]NQE91782.1 peptidase S1 [Nocardia terpenica]
MSNDPVSGGGAPAASNGGDQPFFDPVVYGNGPDDNVTDVTETAAITHHSITVGGRQIAYTVTAGHLVTVDPSSSQPNAKMFYVAFTEDGQAEETRPVTFFYNGGPGSSSVFLLLGSFAPRRIKTNMPDFTPPAPYTLEDNPDSLIDKSDLVFINPVGTGYSAAVAPHKNREFWGTDQDAESIKDFIKRYLTKNNRWNSPKFLFGESYGTARSCVLAYRLHEDGVDLNGITLLSSILDYAQSGNPIGILPTAAADAWYHQRLGITAPPPDLGAFVTEVEQFASGPYAAALQAFPKPDPATVDKLSAYTGIDKTVLTSWSLVLGYPFLTALLADKSLALGAYDGRVTGIDSGIAGKVDPNSGGNDPTMAAVSGVYTTMWNLYLNEQLKYTSNSSYIDLNDQVFLNWDYSHVDPTGTKQSPTALYTAADLAAVMAINVDLKVLSANGYFDFVTPCYQTVLDLQHMPLQDQTVRQNLETRFYHSGHMIYLDGNSRTALKKDLSWLYDTVVGNREAMARVRELQQSAR